MTGIVKDGFLTEEEIEYINTTVLSENDIDFPWYLSNGATPYQNTPFLTHTIVAREGSEMDVHSEHHGFFVSLLERYCDENNIELNKIHRMCINLTLSNTDKEFFAAPHADHDFEHNNLIIYLNDSSGDTVLFGRGAYQRGITPVTQRVTPKQGRTLLFDGLSWHTGEPPKGDDKRIIIVSTFT